MSFTDQIRRVATAEECKASWAGIRNGENFRCCLCGHRFVVGDGWRWIYGDGRTFETEEGKKYGVRNFTVCDTCDDHALDKWIELHREFYSNKFWNLRGRE